MSIVTRAQLDFLWGVIHEGEREDHMVCRPYEVERVTATRIYLVAAWPSAPALPKPISISRAVLARERMARIPGTQVYVMTLVEMHRALGAEKMIAEEFRAQGLGPRPEPTIVRPRKPRPHLRLVDGALASANARGGE